MRSVSPSQLDTVRSEDDVFVLDVRPESDYQRGHIDGSYNAPVYHELRSGETDALNAYLDDIPTEAEVVTVCKAGVVAKTATQTLDARGYDVATLTGGYMGWRQYEKNTLVYRIASVLSRLRP
ncbi:rhodanese-like domain-containing protein (plasmid) [Halarchaeum sp. CBA1220]|uniref:Sulfurtransferase n=1 Tax=Halarchaeum grantii TaxID=1193105 RepID=A0A830FCQ9_9EURY|nr:MULTISPECIES: rhodanese-like domain-containing protein [Halarchaeum]QLC35492.1 rhodanese-like domain-containing protein [Halarchaeum sp. CBA1220]GGL40617.1 sulfurtransferase [Halarchaeum grantii]